MSYTMPTTSWGKNSTETSQLEVGLAESREERRGEREREREREKREREREIKRV